MSGRSFLRLKHRDGNTVVRVNSKQMSAPFKLLSDAWKESRKQELLKSLPHIKPLHHLSSTDIAAMVEASTFRSFDVGDVICLQVLLLQSACRRKAFTYLPGPSGHLFLLYRARQRKRNHVFVLPLASVAIFDGCSETSRTGVNHQGRKGHRGY